MQSSLETIGLTPENSIVIGSGVLSAYGIRESNDIDVVTDAATYDRLSRSERFSVSETHGRELLVDELFEIGTSWGVLGKDQTFDDLMVQSVVIDGVRYVTLEFLLAVKQSWLQHDAEPRQKDRDDVQLIEIYLAKQ